MSLIELSQFPYQTLTNKTFKILCCIEDLAVSHTFFTASYVERVCPTALSRIVEILNTFCSLPESFIERKYKIECPSCHSFDIQLDSMAVLRGQEAMYYTTCTQCYEYYEIEEDEIIVLYFFKETFRMDVSIRSKYAIKNENLANSKFAQNVDMARDTLRSQSEITIQTLNLNHGGPQVAGDQYTTNISGSQLGPVVSGANNEIKGNTTTNRGLQNKNTDIPQLLTKIEEYLNTSDILPKGK